MYNPLLFAQPGGGGGPDGQQQQAFPQQHAAGFQQEQQQQQHPHQQLPPPAAPGMPPHLRQAYAPQPQQPVPQAQPAAQAPGPGLMGLLAARRNELQQQQQPPPLAAAPPAAPAPAPAPAPAAAASSPAKAPPPGFNPAAAASHAGSAAAPAGPATPGAAAAAAAAPAAARLPSHLQAVSGPGGPAAAPPPRPGADPAPAPPATQPQQPRQPPSQQPPQQQQAPPPRQTPAAAPQRSLEEWKAHLARERLGDPAKASTRAPMSFNVVEALAWLEAYCPQACALLDENLERYLQYMHERNGDAVLSCAMFLVLGHPDVFFGGSRTLTLDSAKNPFAVLNQRISCYRHMFCTCERSRAETLASIIAHRPDVAAWLPEEGVRRLFDAETTSEQEALTALAALAMLPDGWARALAAQQQQQGHQSPRAYLAHYLAAVLQDAHNADKMCAFLARRIADAAAASSGGGGSGGGRPQRESVGSWGSAVSSGASSPVTAAAAAGGGGSAGAPWRSSSTGRGVGVGALMTGIAPGAAAHERSRSVPAHAHADEPQQAAAAGGSNGSSDAIQMGLVQLAKERHDVVPHLTGELQRTIKALPVLTALDVLGALNALPRDWARGRGSPADQLRAVVGRAIAHAQQQQHPGSAGGGGAAAAGGGGSPGADSDGWGWVAAGSGGKDPAGQSAGASSSGGGSNSPADVGAAWRAVKQERPDIMAHMADRHFKLFKLLATPQQQVQALEALRKLSHKSVAQSPEPEGLLYQYIQNQVKMMTQPMHPKLKAALQSLYTTHPSVVAHMDDGIVSRIHALPIDKGMAAVQALLNTEFPPGWEHRCNNATAWLMGVVTRGLREAA